MNRRGFTLIEILAVTMLLAVFSLLSIELFNASAKWLRHGAPDAAQFDADAALHQLRADVWNADEFHVGDRWTALVRQPGGRTVTWRISLKDSTLHRTLVRGERAVAQHAWPLGGELVFEREEGLLIVLRNGRVAMRLHSQLSAITGVVR